MAYVSREEFIKQQEAKKNYVANKETQGNRVGFFSLKEDGQEAIVKFAYTSPDQFDIVTTHVIQTEDSKFGRRVNCIRDFRDPVDKCPLCAAGNPMQQRFYIKLIEYTREEDGTITATPKIWERPASYVNTLNNLFAEYGDISDIAFKIKRRGAAGDMKTTYDILYSNQSIYNPTLYPKQVDAFKDYKVVGGPVMDKTYDELLEIANGGKTETTTPTQPSQPRRVTY